MKAAPDTGTGLCEACGRPPERCPVSSSSQPHEDPKRALAAFSVAANQAVRGSVTVGAVLLALFAAAIKVTRHVSAADVVGVIFAALAVAGGLIYLHPPGRRRRTGRVYGPRLPHPAGPAPTLNLRTEENDMTPDPCSTPADRAWDDVLADAVRVLTEAARLRRPVMRRSDDGEWEPHPLQTEPADWAEFVTLAVAGAAANVGSIDRALEGRPGSWEADLVRGMLVSTVGEDPAELLRHRTEPIRVVLRPAELLQDLGYGVLYEESRRSLQAEQDRHLWRYRLGEDRTWTPLDSGAPAWADAFDEDADTDPEWQRTALPGSVTTVPRSAEDEVAWEALLDREGALEALEYEQDPRAYGEALKAAVLAEAASRYPGVPVEVTLDIDERTWRGDSPYWGATPEEALIDAAVSMTALPWSGIALRDYPPGSVADVERAAGRLPHLRLDRRTASPGESEAGR